MSGNGTREGIYNPRSIIERNAMKNAFDREDYLRHGKYIHGLERHKLDKKTILESTHENRTTCIKFISIEE